MAVQKGDHNKIEYINLLMRNLHDSTDDIYDSLMDEDDVALKTALRQLSFLISQIQTNHIDDQQTP
jgi:hypothetical protein|tara:strand:+ start:15162 stop:15359 length:198 start_codon:yes stop_codon:yes gene_type:complete